MKVLFGDRCSEIEITGAVSDLRVRYVFFEQRIGISHTPVSGGREVQRVCSQVSPLFFPFILPIFSIFVHVLDLCDFGCGWGLVYV